MRPHKTVFGMRLLRGRVDAVLHAHGEANRWLVLFVKELKRASAPLDYQFANLNAEPLLTRCLCRPSLCCDLSKGSEHVWPDL